LRLKHQIGILSSRCSAGAETAQDSKDEWDGDSLSKLLLLLLYPASEERITMENELTPKNGFASLIPGL
jgi:hypothetical protein